MELYPTNLTDKQWQFVEKIVATQERKRKYPLRSIVDGVFYLLKTGCQWRMPPPGFAPWQAVYYYFKKWRKEGVIEELLGTVHSKVRKQLGREESPSMGIIDSRSVKTSHHVDSGRGVDGNKKIKGRKQHLVVDTLGLPVAIGVHEANIHDSKGAPEAIGRLEFKLPRLAKILADGGYRGNLAKWMMDRFGWEMEVVLRPDECPSKFKVLPKRWIVERSFAWLKISGGLRLITSTMQKRLWLWFNWLSVRLCLINISIKI